MKKTILILGIITMLLFATVSVNAVFELYDTLPFGGKATVQKSNTCPVSSGESPSNKSTGVSIGVGYWNVTINDADGNTTSGNITCSNSNWSNWSNQANGTRSCSLGTLSYSTNYTVWLNFTDTHCDVNETYWFITENEPVFVLYATLTFGGKAELQLQTPPSLSDEYPTNGSIDISINPTLRIHASDQDNDLMNITFRTNATGTWSDIGSNNSVSDGYYYQTTTNMNNVTVKYWWAVNATDPTGSGNWTNETYSFTTASDFVAYATLVFGGKAEVQSEYPQISDEYPVNNSINKELQPTFSITVEDVQGIFNITWSYNKTGSWVVFGYNSSCINGTYAQNGTWANETETEYNWSVHVNDTEGHWTNATYNFTTGGYAWGNWSGWWTFGHTTIYDIATPLDMKVNYLDASDFTSHYLETGDPGWINADIDDSGIVNYIDASALTGHYGEEY